MGILIDKDTKVIIQGITGKEGLRAAQDMLASGTKVVCGVTPGKGGCDVCGVPVFDSMLEAMSFDKTATTSVVYVPPLMVKDAIFEAINAGIILIVIVTENVPVKDTLQMIAYANEKGVRIIGPSSIGVLSTGIAKVGSIASETEKDMFSKGPVGIISKSGGMCAETALLLTQNNLGQSTIVGIGGDMLAGSTFLDIARLFEHDDDTKVIVIYGEIGGTYEEELADAVLKKEIRKPIVAFISGLFAESITRELSMGHAGAIIKNGRGTAQQKKEILRKAGVFVCEYHDDIPRLVKEALVKI